MYLKPLELVDMPFGEIRKIIARYAGVLFTNSHDLIEFNILVSGKRKRMFAISKSFHTGFYSNKLSWGNVREDNTLSKHSTLMQNPWLFKIVQCKYAEPKFVSLEGLI